jgi:hypothetical protein
VVPARRVDQQRSVAGICVEVRDMVSFAITKPRDEQTHSQSFYHATSSDGADRRSQSAWHSPVSARWPLVRGVFFERVMHTFLIRAHKFLISPVNAVLSPDGVAVTHGFPSVSILREPGGAAPRSGVISEILNWPPFHF